MAVFKEGGVVMSKQTLIIGDTHLPFEKRGYLKFCKRIEKKFDCTRIVHIGDLVDNHAISYHEHDPDGWSPADEMAEVDKKLKPWFKAFPDVYLCRGNHDNLVDRKGKTVGLPTRCFKTFREMWKLPKGWVDDFQFIFDDVCYEHFATGQYGYINVARKNCMSTVTGHGHSRAGVGWVVTERDIWFGMGVGSGLDRSKYAFAYGKYYKDKPIVGAGIVTETRYGNNAQYFPMEMK